MNEHYRERPRRLRRNRAIREHVSETQLNLRQLMQPYFLVGKPNAEEAIPGFTGVSRLGIDTLSRAIEADIERGLNQFMLFGQASSDEKDDLGSIAYRQNSLIADTLRRLKGRFGHNAVLFTDVCLCPYTSHGHCGHVRNGRVDNDASVDLLCQMATLHAQAGADFVAPSDMMDGRVGTMRKILDQQGFPDTGILAYTAKFSSSYYGPFRDAVGSAPRMDDDNLRDRATYQMDCRNPKAAERELRLDLEEGADMVMVKPALAYLDIISIFREKSDVPVAAYSVSGEYQMVKLLAAQGLADERAMALENLTAIRRAGATSIISYFASQAAREGWLR